MRNLLLIPVLLLNLPVLEAQTNIFIQNSTLSEHVILCLRVADNIGIYNQDLCKALHISEGPLHRDTFQEAEIMLDDFFQELKSFIFDTVFNVHGFEYQGANLRSELIKLETFATRTAYCDEGISRQLAYIQKVFRVMSESIAPIKYYELVEPPGRHYICSIIDLNIRLLTLKSSFGGPEFAEKGLGSRVNLMKKFLMLLKLGFENHKPVPFGKQMMFELHYCQAEGTLNDLSGYVAKYECLG